jgi:acetylornithine/N-succinyldiaminopimelate aminotransferase
VVAAAHALSPVGLLINAPRPNLLRLMPALTISDDEIDQGLELLREALHTALR